MQAINDLLTRCTKYDQEAINVSLKRDGGKFTVVEGQTGYVLDVEKSIDAVYDYLTEEWNHEACSIPLEIVVDEPKGSAEELAQVTDVLGSFTTSYKTSGSSRSANVANGCSLINGTTLYPGEEFSTYKTVSPFPWRTAITWRALMSAESGRQSGRRYLPGIHDAVQCSITCGTGSNGTL